MHGSVRTHIHVVCRRTEMHLMHGSVLTNINAGSDVHLMHGRMLTNIQHVVAFNACSIGPCRSKPHLKGLCLYEVAFAHTEIHYFMDVCSLIDAPVFAHAWGNF